MNNNYDFDDMKRQKAAVLDMLGLTPNTPTTGTPAPDGDLEARLAQALRDMCQIAQIACGLGVISDMREDMTGPYPTAIRLLAEYDAARSGAAPIAGQRQTTHWDGCWRDSGHHACAVAEIERLRSAPVAAGYREVTLEDAFNIKRDADGIPCLQSEAEDMLTALHSYGAVIRTDAKDREPPHCPTCDCGPK